MDNLSYSRIEVCPVSAIFGAEISGVDLSVELDEVTFAEIKDAFHRYSVIFFYNQDLTPDQHLAFANRWGDININRFFKAVDGYPMIAEVVKEADQKETIGGGWHTDHSYDDEPAMGSILYARDVPALGGDTIFASMHAAYEGLSTGMKKMLCGLRAWHSSCHAFGFSQADSELFLDGRLSNMHQATQEALHPVVITHPETGRKALYVNPGFTVRFDGWTLEESQPLLDYLYEFGAQPDFQYRLKWYNNSLAMWDNCCTWHFATNDYHGRRRELHRITIEGSSLT